MAVVSPAPAQPPGEVTHGNARYFFSGGASSELGAGHITFLEPEGITTGSHLSINAWFYRVSGDTRERAFGVYTKSDGGTISGTSNYSGNVVTLTYTETLGGSTRFTVLYTGVLTDGPAANIATLSQSFAVTNASGTAPLTIALFNYANIETGATSTGDKVTGGLSFMNAVDGANRVVFTPAGASAYQAGFAPTLLSLLTDSNVNNLNNTGLPYDESGVDNFSGAYQWNVTLNPGQTITIMNTIAVNPVAVPELSSLLLALGGIAFCARTGWLVGQEKKNPLIEKCEVDS
jgi:hypothetical protein